jgi:hypothetical protein
VGRQPRGEDRRRRGPEQLEPEIREAREPDFSDLEDERPTKQRVKSNRPEPRAAVRGTGRAKGHPRHASAEAKVVRERYQKPHPRAGQFIPLNRAG